MQKKGRRPKNVDCDHFGTGRDSDRRDCLLTSYFGDGPVAVAPGSEVVATFASGSKACRTLARIDVTLSS